MNSSNRSNLLTLGVVAVGAAALGMVLTGGLGVTPQGQAARLAPLSATTPVAAPAVVVAPTSLPDFANLADRVNPSVIAVYTEEVVKPGDTRRFHREMDPFEFFFGPRMSPEGMRPQRRQGAGSGFFISTDGLALTNNHVIDGAEKINVRLTDNTETPAKIVGRDPATDVALIRVEGKGPFSPLALGDSDALRVGEWVMAVGNPLRMEHTVTVGVVSAKGRALGLSEETRSFENFIQTDAAINLGNSGGPLVNLRGEVVGMNSAINAAGQNLGFAVPVNTIKAVLPQLKDKGKVVRGYLGVMIKNVDQETQEAFNLTSRDGAFVDSVEKGGPAEKAGVQAGDTIVKVDGTPIKETRQLIDRVSAIAPGGKVDLEVIREGKARTLTATLTERPGTEGVEEAEGDTPQGAVDKLGLSLEDLTARSRRGLEIPNDVEGAVVTDVAELSPAEDGGLRAGDVITQANGVDVTSVKDFRSVAEKVKAGGVVRLYVFRPQLDRSTFVILRMP